MPQHTSIGVILARTGVQTPTFGVYQVRNFAFETSNAEMQSQTVM